MAPRYKWPQVTPTLSISVFRFLHVSCLSIWRSDTWTQAAEHLQYCNPVFIGFSSQTCTWLQPNIFCLQTLSFSLRSPCLVQLLCQSRREVIGAFVIYLYIYTYVYKHMHQMWLQSTHMQKMASPSCLRVNCFLPVLTAWWQRVTAIFVSLFWNTAPAYCIHALLSNRHLKQCLLPNPC